MWLPPVVSDLPFLVGSHGIELPANVRLVATLGGASSWPGSTLFGLKITMGSESFCHLGHAAVFDPLVGRVLAGAGIPLFALWEMTLEEFGGCLCGWHTVTWNLARISQQTTDLLVGSGSAPFVKLSCAA